MNEKRTLFLSKNVKEIRYCIIKGGWHGKILLGYFFGSLCGLSVAAPARCGAYIAMSIERPPKKYRENTFSFFFSLVKKQSAQCGCRRPPTSRDFYLLLCLWRRFYFAVVVVVVVAAVDSWRVSRPEPSAVTSSLFFHCRRGDARKRTIGRSFFDHFFLKKPIYSFFSPKAKGLTRAAGRDCRVAQLSRWRASLFAEAPTQSTRILLQSPTFL